MKWGNEVGIEEGKVCRFKVASLCMALVGSCALAQTVQPVISEYQMKADGSSLLTTVPSHPMVVVLEPKSFSITADGQGVFARWIETFMWNSQP